MPIYEFACKKCEHRFELVRSIAKMDDPAPCPECRSKRTQRLISQFAIVSGADPDIMSSDIDPGDIDPDWDDDDGGAWDDF